MRIKKCPVCGKETGNLGVHIKSHDKKLSDFPADNSFEGISPGGYATKSDLEELKTLILSLPGKKETIVQKEEKVSELPDITPVSPKYRAMVDEILGPEYGINIVYPDQGSGFLFKLIIPLELSNASKDHKAFYKCDVRTKSIGYNEGLDGVRKHIEKVARNLKIIKK